MKRISDLLRETRETKKLSLQDIEDATKIKKVYIEAIERGDFKKLPSESYAQGFVKNYAQYLGISAGRSVPLFRREYESKQKIGIVPEFRRSQHKFNKSFFLSPRSLLVVAVCLVIGVYIFVQYSSLIFPPAITVNSPKNGAIISGNIVTVKGKTDPYATVTVDNDEVYVDLQGNFQKSEYLFPGNNKISIIAKNRYGKESQRSISIRVQ